MSPRPRPVRRDPLAGRTRPQPSHADAEIAAVLAEIGAERIAVLSGAGMSTDSGIPDYRGPHAPQRRPMTYEQFLSGPAARARYWARGWAGWRLMGRAQPNAGHRLLAGLGVGGLITQNVDGLDREAGSQRLVELHGRLDRVVCLSCGHTVSRDWMQAELDVLNPGFLDRIGLRAQDVVSAPDGDAEIERTESFAVRGCPECGGLLKPDVVFFGEAVPRERVAAATAIVDEAAALVVLGSSLAVMSGLRFVRQAAKGHKPVVIAVDGPSRGDELADYRSLSRTVDFLTAWTAAEAGSR